MGRGEQVWVTDAKSPGTVLQNHSTPRSYLVDLPQGVVRRNRQHLISMPSPTRDGGSSPQQLHGASPEPAFEPAPMPLPAAVVPEVVPKVIPKETSIPRTRSGRAVKKP